MMRFSMAFLARLPTI